MKNMRDILLLPNFDNMDVIEKIRKDNDELYGIVPPHITIVFPFEDDMSDDELVVKVRDYFKDKKKFYVKFSGVSFSDDNYIFLDCVEGKKDIIKIHDELYNNYFQKYLSDREYIPHITIGQTFNSSNEQLKKIENMKDEFECYIDTIIIENIGLNEESIILDKIVLGGKNESINNNGNCS